MIVVLGVRDFLVFFILSFFNSDYDVTEEIDEDSKIIRHYLSMPNKARRDDSIKSFQATRDLYPSDKSDTYKYIEIGIKAIEGDSLCRD